MLPDYAALTHFHFLRPEWGLLLLPWLAIAWLRRRRSRADSFGGIIAPHLLEHLRVKRFRAGWLNPATVSAVLVPLITLLLMGPSWRQQPSPLAADEAALVVLLDVSASMQQRDVQPSRLERAKQKIADLLALRPDKKTALIAYAGSAHTVLSLTADQDILKQYLAAIEPAIMPRNGKFAEYALPLVDALLRETSAAATLVLFTDGSGADTRRAFADWFSTRPHQLLVIGVGSLREGRGLAPLERRALERLAGAASGHYIDLSLKDDDMRAVSRRIDSHYLIAADSALPWLDSGYVLVFPALGLFLLWFRRGWTLTWSWLLLALLLTPAPAPVHAQGREQSGARGETAAAAPGRTQQAWQWLVDLWLTPDQQGRLLLQFGHYREAAARFERPLWQGTAYYYAEEFMLAAEYFSRSDSDAALFNQANARAQARDYLRALQTYDRLLQRRPGYPGAAANRAIVQTLVDDINRLSESQQQEPGTSGEELAADGEDPVPATGADELSWEQPERLQFTAEEILQDAATRDMWLRGVQRDPSSFLSAKFHMQLQRAADSAGDDAK